MKKIITMILIIALLMASCQNRDANKVRIAMQYGLAYAPLIIAKEKGFIELEDQSLEVEWLQLANTAAIRESMLAGQLDIGFMGIPPFLIGYDKGMPWHVFMGLSESPLGLMTNQKHINKLSDFTKHDRIATPQPGSIQHILLMMAAEKEFANATLFDDQLVSLKHPDAMNMLLNSTEIVAHFASEPYLSQERTAGMHQVVSGNEAFGDSFTFIVGTVYDKSDLPASTRLAVQRGLIKAQQFITENPTEAQQILADYFNIDTQQLKDYLLSGTNYSSDVKGIARFIEFMKTYQYIEGDILPEEVILE